MNGGSLVYRCSVDVVKPVFVLQQPGVGLDQCLRQAAVQPFLHGGGAELAALLDHHLEGVCQLEFPAGADVVVHQVAERFPERLGVHDVVDAYDGLVANKFLGLFDQSFDVAFCVGHGHAESARVFDPVRVENVFVRVGEALEVRLEQGVTEDNEDWFVVSHVGEREAHGLAKPLRVALQYGAGLAPIRAPGEELVDGLGLVPGNEDGLCCLERVRVRHNPVDNGLAAHGQQALRQVVGVRAHAFALAGYGQNDFHVFLFLFRPKIEKCSLSVNIFSKSAVKCKLIYSKETSLQSPGTLRGFSSQANSQQIQLLHFLQQFKTKAHARLNGKLLTITWT